MGFIDELMRVEMVMAAQDEINKAGRGLLC